MFSKTWCVLTGFLCVFTMALLSKPKEAKALGDCDTRYFARISIIDGNTCNNYLGAYITLHYEWTDSNNVVQTHAFLAGYNEGNFDDMSYKPFDVKIGSTVKLVATYAGLCPYITSLGCGPSLGVIYTDLTIGTWQQGNGNYIDAGAIIVGGGG